jgi:hypothetical protein
MDSTSGSATKLGRVNCRDWTECPVGEPHLAAPVLMVERKEDRATLGQLLHLHTDCATLSLVITYQWM